MGKERVTLQFLDHRHNTVVPADSQIIPLSNVMCENYARTLSDSAKHRQQHVAFQGLRLVDDNERVVQANGPEYG